MIFEIQKEKSENQFKNINSTVTLQEHTILMKLAKENNLTINKVVRQMIRHCLNDLKD